MTQKQTNRSVDRIENWKQIVVYIKIPVRWMNTIVVDGYIYSNHARALIRKRHVTMQKMGKGYQQIIHKRPIPNITNT